LPDGGDDVTVIELNYEPGTPDPGRIFRSMAGLIDAFSRIDRHLARSVATSVEPQVILERIEAGSIRSVLRTLLVQIDDDALRNLDWKPLIGQYLVKAKHTLLRKLQGHPRITSREDVIDLQRQLLALAPANIDMLPPAPISTEDLLWDIEALSGAVAELSEGDSAAFISADDETRIETRLRITAQEIESLLTKETVCTTSEHILLVKKPDYLGHSMWEFRLGDRSIEAKMLDQAWLERFQRQEIALRPGDALRAIVRIETAEGFEGHPVATHYFVVTVLRVVRAAPYRQTDLPE
jgi:hypothetical protein